MPIEPSRMITLPQLGDVSELRKAQQRSYDQSPITATGHYINASEPLTISYETDDPSEPCPTLRIGDLDPFELFNDGQLPQVELLKKGDNRIVAKQDGILYLDFAVEPSEYQYTVSLQEGGHPMPHFVRNKKGKEGSHSQADWLEMLDTYQGAPYAELVGRRTLINVRFKYAKEYVDDAPTLLKWYDKITNLIEKQYGIGPNNKEPHCSPLQRYHHIEAERNGGFSTQYKILYGNFPLSNGEQPLGRLLNSEKVYDGGWATGGYLIRHELGHHQQMETFTWEGTAEATAELSHRYVQRTLEKPSGLEHLWPDAFEYLNQPDGSKDFNQMSKDWIKSFMFYQFDLAFKDKPEFGNGFYAKLARHYREMPENELPKTDEEKQQIFILKSSQISGYNMLPFFDKWGLKYTPEIQEAIDSLDLKPLTNGCIEGDNEPIWDKHDKVSDKQLEETPLRTAGFFRPVCGLAEQDITKDASIKMQNI
jgi:hypothetical protein